MTTFRNVLFSFALLTGCTALAQGNHITLGIDPGQATTGTASNGGAGNLGITIGGHGTIPIDVPAGTDSNGIATAAAAALTAQGFTVVQNGTDITVTSGPGGAPLMHGGGIGSTDTGIDGVRCRVTPAPGGAAGAGPAGKQNGARVNRANPQKQAQQPGQIQVDVEVEKLVNGVWTLLWIQVVVPVQPGDDGQAVNDRVRQQLEAQGLIVNDITLPTSVAPITPSGCFGLDRTRDGGSVQGVRVGVQGGAREVMDGVDVGAGQAPDQGATEYDRSIDRDGNRTEDVLFFQGDATTGQGGVFEALVAPNQFGLWIFGNGPGGLLQAPFVPLPFVGPDFYMPLDPFGGLLFGDITSPLGEMNMPLPIPPDPQLGGLELQLTALTLEPFAGSLFAGASRTNAVTVRIGN